MIFENQTNRKIYLIHQRNILYPTPNANLFIMMTFTIQRHAYILQTIMQFKFNL